jgi:FkbM family methyltransferase
VGANEGQRTTVFLELGARVVVVEPQAGCQQRLRRRFGREPRVVLVAKALGAEPGTAEMQISDADMLSSLSREWIARVSDSGRFSDYAWDRRQTVEITTLDRLLAEHGTPAFCKVDVEGFEDQVFQGLSRPLRAVSFEFTPEYLQAALRSTARLAGLGSVRFNYSLGESMRLELAEWVAEKEIVRCLETLPDRTVFGDVYARFT